MITFIETERAVVAWDQGEEGIESYCLISVLFYFGKIKNVLERDGGVLAQ